MSIYFTEEEQAEDIQRPEGIRLVLNCIVVVAMMLAVPVWAMIADAAGTYRITVLLAGVSVIIPLVTVLALWAINKSSAPQKADGVCEDYGY